MSWQQERSAQLFDTIDTPSVLIELAVMERNLQRMQTRAQVLKKSLRPHSKTHKIPELARRQVELGAEGVMVAKLDEAEAMLRGGITSQSVGYPLIGTIKARRLMDLISRGLTPRVSVDSVPAVDLLDRVGVDAGCVVDAMIEVDTGLHRCGLRNIDDIVALAQYLAQRSFVRFSGITCFGGHIGYRPSVAETVSLIDEEDALLDSVAAVLSRHGLDPGIISEGGTVIAHFAERLKRATELRPGIYIFNDVSTVCSHAATWEDCAAHVLTTVVTRPDPTWAVIDAGSKTLSLDPSPSGGYGYVSGREDLRVTRLTEEHGIIEQVDGRPFHLHLGERLLIVPNHICTTINLHDRVALVESGRVLRWMAVEGRGGIH